MAMKRLHSLSRWTAALFFALLAGMAGCNEEEAVLAPYGAAGRPLSKISIESGAFLPRITWLGGYVSVFGINRGSVAKLDTSLLWLIYQAGDNIQYPVTVNKLPPGAQNLTGTYGGRPQTQLLEDHQYTFWVLKENAWAQVSANAGKPIVSDSTIAQTVIVRNDSVIVSTLSLMNRTAMTDLYINITDVNAFGKLVTDLNDPAYRTYLTVVASDTCNKPVVTWTIVQTGVTDQKIAAVGICEGSEYSADASVWEMISADVQPDTTIYWKNNVIGSPLRMGDHVQGTMSFKEYPSEGLHRGSSYYFWMAGKNWDGKSRSRTANNYAYMTFTVW